MSTTVIDKLVSAGQTLSGKVYRAVAGENEVSGKSQPIRLNSNNNLLVAWSILDGTKDAFGRLRSAEPFATVDIKQVNDEAPLQFVTDLTSGGTSTYNSDLSSSELDVTTTVGSKTIRQTRHYLPYQPGRTQVQIFTGVFGAANPGVRKRMGYFDDNNGLFFEQDVDGTIYAVRRSNTSGSVVNEKVAQADWNIDSLDGNGPSGRNIDPTEFWVMVTAFAWLGGAGATLAIIVDGQINFTHAFDIDSLSTPFIRTPSLPIRWEIEQIDGNNAGTLIQTCCAGFSEGGFNPKGVVSSYPRTSSVTVSTSLTPIISVRLKPAYSRGILEPLEASGAVVSNNDNIIFRVIARGTLTGASWFNSDTDATELDTSATSISGGITMKSFFANDNAGEIQSSLEQSLVIASDFNGNADVLTLAAQALSGNVDAVGSLSWKELY